MTVLQHRFIPVVNQQLILYNFHQSQTIKYTTLINFWKSFLHFDQLLKRHDFWKGSSIFWAPAPFITFQLAPLPCTFPQAASSYGTSKLVLRFSVNPWELPPKPWVEIWGGGYLTGVHQDSTESYMGKINQKKSLKIDKLTGSKSLGYYLVSPIF